MTLLNFTIICIFSTLMYLYLHRKTHISLSSLYTDNLIAIFLAALSAWLLRKALPPCPCIAISVITIPLYGLLLTLVRFYRVPLRPKANFERGIVSPADGHIIYIKHLEKGDIPISVKNGLSATLNEFTKTNLLDSPCWLIGINMTPFDVHKNCAPTCGTIVLNQHTTGEFLSLKNLEALARNERNSIIIDNPKGRIGIVQTASRLVRRIVTYKSVGDQVDQGDWIGMIKFGSQVDLILPDKCTLLIQMNQQVFARKTQIATWE